MKRIRKAIECKDGFAMSVQASETHYCQPRINGAQAYTEVEVGYPNQEEPLLMPWIDGYIGLDGDEDPCEAVYGWVPYQVILKIIARHGGLVSGELPPFPKNN